MRAPACGPGHSAELGEVRSGHARSQVNQPWRLVVYKPAIISLMAWQWSFDMIRVDWDLVTCQNSWNNPELGLANEIQLAFFLFNFFLSLFPLHVMSYDFSRRNFHVKARSSTRRNEKRFLGNHDLTRHI